MKKDFAPPFTAWESVLAWRNTAGALHYFGQAILIDPRFTMARIDRGLLLMQQGSFDEAVDDFQAGSPDQPGS